MNSHVRTNRSQSARMPFTRIGLAGVVVVSVLFSAAHNVQAAARSQNDYSTLPTSFIANTATITVTSTATITPTPTLAPTLTNTLTVTPTPTTTLTLTPSATPSPTLTLTPTLTTTPTPTIQPRKPDTIGIFRPSAATFYLRASNTHGYADLSVQFGAANSLPVVSDWTGAGVSTVGVFDPTANGVQPSRFKR